MIPDPQLVPNQRKANSGSSSKGDIVLIHGLWMTPLSWEKWAEHYEAQGYNVITPTWPMMEGKSIDEIRKNPEILSGVGVTEIFEHLMKIVSALDNNPILIGHSFGGLFVQLLLNRGFGTAGVAIHSAQTRGVLRLPISVIKAAWPALKNPFDINGIVDLSFDEFKFAFANGIPEDEALAGYNRYYIPSPKRPLIQVALSNFNPKAVNIVDYKNADRAPLLFIGGSSDHITPPSVNMENRRAYKTKSVTEYKEFSLRPHFTVAQSGWEEVADYALNWCIENQASEDVYGKSMLSH
jgi:pimeloyl-ACP methyl ester carboxylesterase